MNKHLRIIRRETHLELTLNRPECRNALSEGLMADLTDALRQAGADDQARSVIVTGTPPVFCAGLDLREVAQAQAEHDVSPLLTLFETIEHLPKPVIAAVNGPAVAGGAGLVSVCDIALCAASAYLGYPGVKRGLVGPIITTYLCRLVGERYARWLLLTGESVPAARALEMGLINEVVADAELLERARRHATLFASHPPQALADAKALFHRLRNQRADSAETRRLNSALPLAPESRAGLEEFLGE